MIDKKHARRMAEANAQQLLSELPTQIRLIVERLPFGARWMLAGAIIELHAKRDVYSTGIALGMVMAASAREEITSEQMETLALYVGNVCPDQLLSR